MLAEHADWKAAVRDAVLRRRQLEAEAAHESPDVLRPIVLFQAQDRSGTVTPEVLRQHLLDEAHASADEIVIATGDQRGLDGVDLFDRRCPALNRAYAHVIARSFSNAAAATTSA